MDVVFVGERGRDDGSKVCERQIEGDLFSVGEGDWGRVGRGTFGASFRDMKNFRFRLFVDGAIVHLEPVFF